VRRLGDGRIQHRVRVVQLDYAALSRCGSFQPGRGKWQV
jgi:hypothetical protein